MPYIKCNQCYNRILHTEFLIFKVTLYFAFQLPNRNPLKSRTPQPPPLSETNPRGTWPRLLATNFLGCIPSQYDSNHHKQHLLITKSKISHSYFSFSVYIPVCFHTLSRVTMDHYPKESIPLSWCRSPIQVSIRLSAPFMFAPLFPTLSTLPSSSSDHQLPQLKLNSSLHWRLPFHRKFKLLLPRHSSLQICQLAPQPPKPVFPSRSTYRKTSLALNVNGRLHSRSSQRSPKMLGNLQKSLHPAPPLATPIFPPLLTTAYPPLAAPSTPTSSPHHWLLPPH